MSTDFVHYGPLSVSQTSEYPVIISLENHCTVEQQKLMAHHMVSILGDALLTQPLGDQMPLNFPSPEVSTGFIQIKWVFKKKYINK